MRDRSLAALLRDREAIADLLEQAGADAPLRGARELGVAPERIRRALAGGAALESVGSGHDRDDEMLEAIVRLHARPSLLVTAGGVATESDVWRRRLDPHAAALQRAIAAVGRVDVLGHDRFDWIGTAWVVAENTVVTNRHVLEEFARQQDGRWLFLQTGGQQAMTADVDFVAERGRADVHKVRVARIAWVWHGPGPSADLALLELDGDGIPSPIPLADDDGAPDQFVAVVGYPAKDARNADAPLVRIFGDLYGVKRCAPGQILRHPDALRFEHDCSTLGGNSGSVVLDLATGTALGLHFGGIYQQANFAVRASVVKQALARARVKVSMARPAAAPTIAPTAAPTAAPSAAPPEAPAAPAGRSRPAPTPVADARRALMALRDARRHAELVALGQRFLAEGQDHPVVRRLCAQGLIETGALDAAIATLEAAAADLAARLARADDPAHAPEALWVRNEQAEVQGLLGRSFKQRYLAAGPTRDQPRTADAERACAAYGEAYRASAVTNLWHGINVVALRCHQHRLLRADDASRDAEADRVADDVLKNLAVLAEVDDLDAWNDATRAEALLALGRLDEFDAAVTSWLARPDLTPFMIESFARQLREVWQLDAATPPGHVLARLAARAAPGADTADESPQEEAPRHAPAKATFTKEAADNRAARCARGVARLGASFYEGSGSGFLLDPAVIWPDYDGPRDVLLLTNAHVCGPGADPNDADGPLHPRAARFVFLGPRGEAGRETLVASAELLWSSPADELDATLLLLADGPDAEPPPVRDDAPRRGERANIVGYALGGGLWYATEQNVVDDADDRFVLYTTRTEAGMSGSPVFDDDWRLFALHRHHQLDRQLNGGVRIDRVLAAMRAALLPKFGPRGPQPYLGPDRPQT